MAGQADLTAPGRGAAVRCIGLAAGYDGTSVLSGIDLVLEPGRVLAVLGTSGAGKTTLLHALAGFIRPTSGEIWLGDEIVAGNSCFVEPERRGVGVVFQEAALWPHLDALRTVAYPLRRQGMARAEAEREAHRLLDLFGLAGLARRRPHELSGGEQQRVGLARALARDARLYLLDEPTVHLDLPLRQVAQQLLESGRRKGGAAAVYTTHEAADALAMADQVAILVAGRLAQVGTADEVYERPVDASVAELTGAASLLDVEVGPGRAVVIDGVRCAVQGSTGTGPHRLLVRPGWAALDGPLKGVVVGVRFQGPHTDHELHTSAGTVVVRQAGAPRRKMGDQTGWTLDRGWLLPPRILAGS
ncbi:MAG TPA: ABC transporter ATP-binding protein [Candidatus Dormibacteraeota bacterium]|nr:ABC transporter ATP-binding protein [Candidatus Dormibacteraeota bacterium]